MPNTPTWPDYLRRVTSGATGADIARTTGIPPSTISRWLNGETKPSPDKIEQLARHYPMQLDEALRVVAAYRPPNAAVSFNLESPIERVVLRGGVSRAHLLEYYSDLELAQEIVRRIEAGLHVETGAPLPLADGVVAERPSNVSQLRPGNVASTSDDFREVAFDTEVDHTTDHDNYDA